MRLRNISRRDRGEREREQSLSRSEAFDVLSNQRRRFVLHILKQRESSVYLREIAEQVAAWESGKQVEAVTAAERNRVQTALLQFHVPRMEDVGVVEYDPARKRVELAELGRDVDIYLSVVQKDDIPWGPVYLWVTGITVGVLLTSSVDIPPGTFVSYDVWLVMFVLTIGVVSTVHTYQNYYQMRLGATEKPPEVEGEHAEERDHRV